MKNTFRESLFFKQSLLLSQNNSKCINHIKFPMNIFLGLFFTFFYEKRKLPKN